MRLPNIPVIPIVAFVALAAIGLFATSMGSQPAYSAMLSIPGEPPMEQALAAEGGDASGGAQGASGEGGDSQGGATDDPNILIVDSEEPSDSDGTAQIEVQAADGSQALVDIAAVPFSEEVETFTTNDGQAASVSDSSLGAISDAYAQLTDGGIDAGFVFVSMETGNGIASNADKKVYGASSIKGPMVTYICEELIDGGEISTSTGCKTMTESFKVSGSAPVGNLIETTIRDSANGSYGGLYTTYGGNGYSNWLESLGVSPGIYERSDWYAWYTARDAAKMWNEVYEYVNSGSDTAAWLKELMRETNVSYIRDAKDAIKAQLEESEWRMPASQGNAAKLIKATADSVTGYKSATSIVDGISVINKAGWCVGDSSKVDYDSTSDNAIVTIDGHDFLLCIMTGAPYNERNASNVTNLAASLISTYDELV